MADLLAQAIVWYASQPKLPSDGKERRMCGALRASCSRASRLPVKIGATQGCQAGIGIAKTVQHHHEVDSPDLG
jgi:hypothetical protein